MHLQSVPVWCDFRNGPYFLKIRPCSETYWLTLQKHGKKINKVQIGDHGTEWHVFPVCRRPTYHKT